MKTAVEYLEEAINISSKETFYDLVEVISMAKAMERGQIIDAYWAGINGSINDYSEAEQINNELIGVKTGKGAEKYYNDTFKPNA